MIRLWRYYSRRPFLEVGVGVRHEECREIDPTSDDDDGHLYWHLPEAAWKFDYIELPSVVRKI